MNQRIVVPPSITSRQLEREQQKAYAAGGLRRCGDLLRLDRRGIADLHYCARPAGHEGDHRTHGRQWRS